ncbi:glutamate--tRNA ligase [candidate division GN15 bacterium]|nr:glutamate--tRNA ligase [candidate division GN15 bacterium]
MTDKPVRVRIAPSPTGYLHVGTARSALFNYLFARHYDGKFLVRVEDTDVERSKKEYIEPILDAMRWLGLDWDEDIIYQSERLDHYRGFVDRLLESGHAYRCFCTREELEAERERAKAEKQPARYSGRCRRLNSQELREKLASNQPYTVRIAVPEGTTSYDDMVSGTLSRHSNDIEDFIIARSDGSATYNFAVVIDDHEMGITHVIRGNDHITNTFKQIQIYRAFEWPEPQFGHVPLILRPDKKKVSKRLGDRDVGEYRRDGIVPEAMFNYLCLLGWNPKTEQEIYRREELIERFTEANFNASNAIFDEEKLIAFNKAHIVRMTDHDLAVLVAPMLVEADVTTKYWLETRWEYLRHVISLLKERVRTLHDFVGLGGYFFSFDYTYEEKADAKQFTPEAAELLTELADRFEALDEFSHDSLEAALKGLAGQRELKPGKLIHPTRLAVSGMSIGPGLYDLLQALGKPIVVERMRKAVEYIQKKHRT